MPGLKVLGAGLPRTGTNSLMKALEILGYPCHHMESLMSGGLPIITPWHTLIMQGEMKDRNGIKRDMKWLFETYGYEAGVDYPVAAFWKEILEEHPDAKVVLTVREVTGWCKSFSILEESVGKLMSRLIPIAKFFCWMAPVRFVELATTLHSRFPASAWYQMKDPNAFCLSGRTRLLCEDEGGLAKMKAAFDAHNAEVKAKVPAGQLLVFDCREGWAPLCKFLGKPIPDVPFPNTNSTSSGGAAWNLVVKNFRKLFFKGEIKTVKEAPAATEYKVHRTFHQALHPVRG